jgi:hypothetical protein
MVGLPLYVLLASILYSLMHASALVLSSHYQYNSKFKNFCFYSLLPNFLRLTMIVFVFKFGGDAYLIYSAIFLFFLIAFFTLVVRETRNENRITDESNDPPLKALSWQVYSTLVLMGFTTVPQVFSVSLYASEQLKIVSFIFLLVSAFLLFPNILYGRVYFKFLNENAIDFVGLKKVILKIFFISFFASLFLLMFAYNVVDFILGGHVIGKEVLAVIVAIIPIKTVLVFLQTIYMRDGLVRTKFYFEFICLTLLVVVSLVSNFLFGINGFLCSIVLIDMVLLYLFLSKLNVR